MAIPLLYHWYWAYRRSHLPFQSPGGPVTLVFSGNGGCRCSATLDHSGRSICGLLDVDSFFFLSGLSQVLEPDAASLGHFAEYHSAVPGGAIYQSRCNVFYFLVLEYPKHFQNFNFSSFLDSIILRKF
jgi:hypothetical protein